MAACNLVEIQDLTNLCFHSQDYLKNFPQVFKPENSEYFIYLKDQEKLICFCTIYPTYFLFQGRFLKGFCVGSVCTHPNYRGKGLASTILRLAEEKAKFMQGSFVYLFSEKNKLYEKAGYFLCGKSYLASINFQSKLFQEYKKLEQNYFNFKVELFNDLNSEFTAKIWSFIIQYSKPSESILPYLEFKDIIKIKNMKIYFLTHNEKICSVCFFNKGDDFKDVIHGVYYLNKNYAILLINNLLVNFYKNKNYLFFPGVFYEDFQNFFDYQEIPTMYVKSLEEKHYSLNDIKFLTENNDIFVRSLQGT